MTMWSPQLDAAQRPIYRSIVRALSEDIERGRLRPGDRLPTHRELGSAIGVAVGTITRAYAEAERLGLVRGEIGRGTFVSTVSDGFPLVKNQDASRSIDLSLNEPLYACDPDASRVLQDLARRPDLARLFRYQPPEGIPRHRAAGAAWIERAGVKVPPDRVVVCAGAQHALVVTFASIAKAGDWIFTEELTYPGIKGAAKLLRLRLHGVAMDEHGLIPDALESACRQRKAKALYCMPTIHNPTTATLSNARRRRIAEIARRHDLAIVEDDVLRPLADDPSVPLASLAPERCYFITTMSKTVTAGLRVAFVSCPVDGVPRMAENIWATQCMVAPMMAEIAATWIEDGTADLTLRRKRVATAERQRIASEVLRGCRFQADPRSYHLWLELPAAWSSASFVVEARRRGVSVTTSEAFVVGGSAAPKAVRVCVCAAEDDTALRTGLTILARLSGEDPDGCHTTV